MKETEPKPQPEILLSENVDKKIPLSEKRNQNENPFRKIYDYISNNKSRKTYTLLTSTFVFISILIIFAIFPTVSSISQIVKKIEDYKVIKLKQQDKISSFYQLQLQATNSVSNGGISEHVQFFDNTYFPDQIKEEDIFRDLIDLSATNKVDVDDIKYSEIVPIGSFEKVKGSKFQLVVSSREKENVEAMIKALTNSKHFYTVLRSSILSPAAIINNKPSNDDASNRYTSTINFIAYYYV